MVVNMDVVVSKENIYFLNSNIIAFTLEILCLCLYNSTSLLISTNLGTPFDLQR